MEKVFKGALKALLGCLLVLPSFPSYAHVCTIQKVSDGFFTQTGGGNTFSTTSTGGYRSQLTITNYSVGTPLTFGPTVSVLPTGLSPSKVTITYTITTDSGLTLYEGTDQDLLLSPFSYTASLPSSYTVFIDVRVQEQSGLKTNTEQYTLSIDTSC